MMAFRFRFGGKLETDKILRFDLRQFGLGDVIFLKKCRLIHLFSLDGEIEQMEYPQKGAERQKGRPVFLCEKFSNPAILPELIPRHLAEKNRANNPERMGNVVTQDGIAEHFFFQIEHRVFLTKSPFTQLMQQTVIFLKKCFLLENFRVSGQMFLVRICREKRDFSLQIQIFYKIFYVVQESFLLHLSSISL